MMSPVSSPASRTIGVPRVLVRVDVTAGSDPRAKDPVSVQHHATPSDDQRRRRHVHRVGVLVERVSQTLDLTEEPLDALPLAVIDGSSRPYGCDHLLLQHRHAWPASESGGERYPRASSDLRLALCRVSPAHPGRDQKPTAVMPACLSHVSRPRASPRYQPEVGATSA
jgi:hypothetical protein